MKLVNLPHIGARAVMPDVSEPGHWLWRSAFGWHDCSPNEDALLNATG